MHLRTPLNKKPHPAGFPCWGAHTSRAIADCSIANWDKARARAAGVGAGGVPVEPNPRDSFFALCCGEAQPIHLHPPIFQSNNAHGIGIFCCWFWISAHERNEPRNQLIWKREQSRMFQILFRGRRLSDAMSEAPVILPSILLNERWLRGFVAPTQPRPCAAAVKHDEPNGLGPSDTRWSRSVLK